MNGFIAAGGGGRRRCAASAHINAPACSLSPKTPDVMGYHDAHEIPNYWAYARHFVLQDHMFQADTSWSLPGHLYWSRAGRRSARSAGDPMSCVQRRSRTGLAAGRAAEHDRRGTATTRGPTSRTSSTSDHVSWRLLRLRGRRSPTAPTTQMFCKRAAAEREARRASGTRCRGSTRCSRTASSGTSRRSTTSCTAARAGTLPAVSWLAPAEAVSEHPPALDHARARRTSRA